jgi:hypothetical protein
VGAVGFALAVLVPLARVATRLRAATALDTQGTRRDAFTLYGLVAFLVLGTLHMPLHHAPVALAFWTLVGLAARGPERTDG